MSKQEVTWHRKRLSQGRIVYFAEGYSGWVIERLEVKPHNHDLYYRFQLKYNGKCVGRSSKLLRKVQGYAEHEIRSAAASRPLNLSQMRQIVRTFDK